MGDSKRDAVQPNILMYGTEGAEMPCGKNFTLLPGVIPANLAQLDTAKIEAQSEVFLLTHYVE